MAEIKLDETRIKQIGSELGATPAQLELAADRAMRRVAGRMMTMGVSIIVDNIEIPATSIRRIRARATRNNHGIGMRIWFGLEPISISHASPRQIGQGIRTTIGMVPGAFIIKKIGNAGTGRHPVFTREGNRLQKGMTMRDAGLKKYPDLKKVFADMESTLKPADGRRLSMQFAPLFFKRFEQELEFAGFK